MVKEKTATFVSEHSLTIKNMAGNISERQAEIIEAAAKLLTSSGVSGLTIKNLAIEMRFSESAIYRHFQSKEDIIVTMLDSIAHRLDSITPNVLQATESEIDVIISLFAAHFDFFSTHTHLVVAIFSDGLLEESKRINEKIISTMEYRKGILLQLVNKGQQGSRLTTAVKSEEIVHIIMGSVRLLMYQWRVSNFSFDIKIKGNALVYSILKILKAL